MTRARTALIERGWRLRRQPVRALALAGLVAAVGLAGGKLPGSVQRLDNREAVGARRTAVERALPAAELYGFHAATFERLAKALPRDAVYTIAMPARGADLASLAFPGLAADYLLPRRRSDDGKLAGYVVTFRVPPASVGLPLSRVVRVGDGVEVGEVAR